MMCKRQKEHNHGSTTTNSGIDPDIILVNVLILRWVFRVNEIVSLLKKILRELKGTTE